MRIHSRALRAALAATAVSLLAAGIPLLAPVVAPSAPVTHAASAAAGTAVGPASATGPVGTRPNIVLITTDDQTVHDLRYMPITRRLIGGQGITYTQAISPHPLCCPARTEILTGQYAQNNGVHHNEGPYGGFQAHDPDHTIAQWLQRAGYQTAFVGKYLNHYALQSAGVLPGWDRFNPTIKDVYSPYGFTVLNHGDPRRVDGVHISDYVGDTTAAYIGEYARGSKPFFIWSSQLAPHKMHWNGRWRPPIPAARHRGLFGDARPPAFDDPAFNERNLRDKSRLHVRKRKVDRSAVRDLYRARLRSLQGVDEATGRIVAALRRAGELDDTVLLFTSDNGHLFGEHRLVGKNVAYEQALRVPTLVRGPGLPAGVKRSQPIGLVDIAPTLMQLAGAVPDVVMDGRSFAPTFADAGARWHSTSLIQAGHLTRPWLFRGVRTSRYTYVRFYNGDVELYDRKRDPAQLQSVHASRQYRAVRRELARRTDLLQSCAGTTCRTPFGALPKVG
jgi:arylsulfatase A-like enzyme